MRNGYTNSAVVSATYTIALGQVPEPVFSPPSGSFSAPLLVSLTDTVSPSNIYYTTNGTTPTTTSQLYSGPFPVDSTTTVNAMATAVSYTNSNVVSATYTIGSPSLDFTVALTPASLNIASGQSGSTQVSIAPLNGFTQPVSFACLGLPAGATCSFSPAIVTPKGGSVSTTLSIALNSTASNDPHKPMPFALAATIALAVCLIGCKRRRSIPSLVLVVICGLGLLLSTGCGGGGSGGQTTPPPPVTSRVTVTATAGSLTHSATLNVTVN